MVPLICATNVASKTMLRAVRLLAQTVVISLKAQRLSGVSYFYRINLANLATVVGYVIKGTAQMLGRLSNSNA